MKVVHWDDKVNVPVTFKISILDSAYILLFYVYECFPCAYVCVPHLYSAHRGQKWALDPLELDSLTVVTWYVSAGIQTWVL